MHVHHAFLYISLLSLHDYNMKMPNCKFYGGCKQAMANLSFSSKLEWGLQEFNSWKFAYIWHFQWIRINTTKFEVTRIHFKSDIFSAVTVVDAKLPRLSVKWWWMKLKLSIVRSWDSLLYRIVSVFMMPEKMWWA